MFADGFVDMRCVIVFEEVKSLDCLEGGLVGEFESFGGVLEETNNFVFEMHSLIIR